jgi:hypothetical protein
VRFVWGMSTQISRTPEGKAVAAYLDMRYQGGKLISTSAVLQIINFCQLLESAPPSHVSVGTLRCPLRTVQQRSADQGVDWPLSESDTLSRLREEAERAPDLIGFDESGQVSWLSVTVNMIGGGGAQASWFEKELKWSEEIQGATLQGWLTASSFAWTEAMDEAIYGSASVLLNTAMFTGATLFFLTGSLRVVASTLFGVFTVLFCLIGWLGLRGFPFGAIEGIGIGIFIVRPPATQTQTPYFAAHAMSSISRLVSHT